MWVVLVQLHLANLLKISLKYVETYKKNSEGQGYVFSIYFLCAVLTEARLSY
jgi:hypothetical protein